MNILVDERNIFSDKNMYLQLVKKKYNRLDD